MEYCFWCRSYFDRHSVRCLCVHGVHDTEPRRDLQELRSMRNSHKLLLEVLDEALRLLPPTVPSFTRLNNYESVPNLRRKPRAHASGLKARRSPSNSRGSQWMDIQALPLTQEAD